MRNHFKIISVLLLGAMLSACVGVSVESNKPLFGLSNKHTKLANGYPVVISDNKPNATMQCTKITANNYLWSKEKFKANLHFGGVYNMVIDQAKAYADSKKINPDYIYIQFPSADVSVGGFDTSTFSHRVWIYYYKCKK